MIRGMCLTMAPKPLWFPTVSPNPISLSKWRSTKNNSLCSVDDVVMENMPKIHSGSSDKFDPVCMKMDISEDPKPEPLFIETFLAATLTQTESRFSNVIPNSDRSEDSGIFPANNISPPIRSRNQLYPLQTADCLISPYQSLPAPDEVIYIYTWTLPEPRTLARLSEVDPKCFENHSQHLGLLFSRPISKDPYVCRVPLYLTRGLARARVYLVQCIKISSENLRLITQAHRILAELLTNIADLSHMGLLPSDETLRKLLANRGQQSNGHLSVRDKFDEVEFIPGESRMLGLVTIINVTTNQPDLQAINALISWYEARSSWDRHAPLLHRNSLPEVQPCSGILPTFPVRLSQIPESQWCCCMVRPCHFSDNDPAMFAVSGCSPKIGLDRVSSHLMEKITEVINNDANNKSDNPTTMEQDSACSLSNLSFVDYFAVRNPSISAMLDHIDPCLPLVVCDRLTRHQNAAQVNAGMRKASKLKGKNKSSMLLADSCFVYPLSAWLWFLLSTTPVLIYQLSRALAAWQLSELLNNQLQPKIDASSIMLDRSNTILVPDRLDAPKCMLSDLNHFTEIDTQVHNTTPPGVDSVDEEIKAKRLQYAKLKQVAPHPMDLLEPTTLLAARDAVNLERLELLGDAFLNLIGTLTIISDSPINCSEGFLTSGRVALVSNANLCRIALQLGWTRYCTGQVYSPPDHFVFPCYAVKASVNASGSDSRLCVKLTDKSLADMMEALIGCFLHRLGPMAALQLVSFFGISFQEHGTNIREGTWRNLFKHDSDTYFPTIDSTVGLDKLDPSGSSSCGTKTSPRATELFTSPEIDASLSDSKAVFSAQLIVQLNGLQNILGYHFRDIELLIQALMHPSSPYVTVCGSYQRLEFLGDSVLSYIITLFLYGKHEDFDPGKLTESRGNIVSNTSLACTVVEHQLHHYIQHSYPLYDTVISTVSAILEKTESYSEQFELLTQEVIKGLRIKFLADVFESIIGAIFVDTDGNLDIVNTLIMRLLSDRLLDYLKRNPVHPLRTMHVLHPTLKYSQTQSTVSQTQTSDRYKLCANLSGECIITSGSTRNEARLALAQHLRVPFNTGQDQIA